MGTDFDKLVKLFPEASDAIRKVKAEKSSGMAPEVRRTYRECKTWHEAWVYIFGRAFLLHDDYLHFEGNEITCVVWPVRDFDDRLVGVLEQIAARIGLKNELGELRLIDTKVSPQGVERLKAILPKATIRLFSREEAKKDQTIEYVNTRVKWIKELHSKKETMNLARQPKHPWCQ